MKTRRLVHFAILLSLSMVGSYIKIPSMVGSLAFDAVPGYFAALCFSPLLGAAVASLGHGATAVVSGFPLGIPIHCLIAIGMGAAAWGTGHAAKRSIILGLLVGTLINGALLPALFILIPGFGMPFFFAATPSILSATILNLVLAAMLYSVPQLKEINRGL